jgi:hypothetical protein
MARTTRALDQEWLHDYAHSDRGITALRRWAKTEPPLQNLDDLDGLLEARTDPDQAQQILAALARHAPCDQVAARTLLQAMLPGLVVLAMRTFRQDRQAFEHVVALAWLRICNYPPTRAGSVAGNVILDVRKDYVAQRKAAAPELEVLRADPASSESAPSAEDTVLANMIFDELADAAERGVIDARDLDVVIRTRIGQATLHEVGADHGTTGRYAKCIRWRAEQRLRDHLPPAA